MQMQEMVTAWDKKIYDQLTRADIDYRLVGRKRVRGPQVFTYQMRVSPDALKKIYAMGDALAYGLEVESVRIGRTLGILDIEIALPKSLHRIVYSRSLQQQGGKTWVTLGMTQAGVPIQLNFAGNRTSQTLIAGTTGSGKTNAQRVIVEMLARKNTPNEMKMLLIDGKGSPTWKNFSRLAHLVHPIITEPQDAVGALGWVQNELLKRKESGQVTPKIFVFVDETKVLIDTGGQAMSEAISTIAAMGREMGVHLVLATQYPLVGAVGGGAAKANLPMRLTGSVVSAQASTIATGIPGAGAHRLTGNGDFLINVGGSPPHRMCVGFQQKKDLVDLPRWGDTTPGIDLSAFASAESLSPKLAPLKPQNVALAVTSGRGIGYLKDMLHIGSARAKRIKEFSDALLEAVQTMGYDVRKVETT